MANFVEGYGLNLKSVETIKGRFYEVGAGVRYPSITTMLGAKEKPAIQAWRQSLGEAKADKETKRAADRGSAVHDMIEKLFLNAEDPTEGHTRENIEHYKRLRPFLKKIDNIHCMEKALFSDDLQLAGRVDCIGEYSGVLSIIDFKTSNGDKTETMIEDYFLQTTAYAVMFEEMYGIKVPQIVILMVSEKGAVPLVFKRDPNNYVEVLVERTVEYHTKFAKKEKKNA